MAIKTPAFGIPVYERVLAELREDFRQHAAKDEQSIGEVRNDVKDLLVSQASQSATLAEIRKALDGRARTEAEDTGYRRKVKLKWWGTAAGIVLTGFGAFIHWWLS